MPSLTVICHGAVVALLVLVLVLDRKRGPHDATKPQVPEVDPTSQTEVREDQREGRREAEEEVIT